MNSPKQPLDTSHVPAMTSACLYENWDTPTMLSIEEAIALASSALSADEYAFDVFEQFH